MRRLIIAAAVAAFLAAAPAAAAKEVTSATVCGVDGCTTTHDRTLLQALTNGGGPAEPPAHPAGAFRVRGRIAEPAGTIVGRFTNWWVPRTQLLVAEDGSWTTLSPRAAEAVASAAHGLKPFGPEKLGSTFAGTSSHAAPPPPIRTGPVSDGGTSVDWWLIVVPAGVALAAAGALLLVRRRPGGATP